MHDHSLAIDVLHAQPDEFAAPNAGGVKQHENRACLEVAGGIDQLGHFLRTQYLRYALTWVLRVRDGVGWKPALQRTDEEES